MATTPYIENYVPVVQENGLNTAKNVDFTAATTVALPSGTTIGGSSVVALSSISGSITTGAALSITTTGVYTGAGVVQTIADSLTTGTASLTSTNGQTTGHNTTITSTGVITTTGDLLNIVGNSATTSTGLVRVSATGMTTGSTMLITGGGANQTSAGKVIEVAMGASTVGVGQSITTTGVYTGAGISQLIANSATTGTIESVSGTGLTTGIGIKVTATAATLTTGFYFAANDGALNSFTIGANGHLTSNQTTAPTIATNATGLSAVAVTAGSTDTCGTITSTGTPASGTVITLTFHKTYTVAPKVVLYTPANAAAGGVNTMPIVTQTATTAVFTWPAGGVYAATPSWTYLVIA